ncbi:hypothetical protein AWC04_19585 [Mycolicibacterium fallax]|uniref:Uncharacterized protein n=2 Tax=Mycolicibacterium fallax TaxID=1793 RepID=A0A1X1QZ86_MYCFA|nr:hypothetical protein AWC04_19585 [Mycolicibacterium fallax]
MLLDLAAADPAAVLRSAELVPTEEVRQLQPAAGAAYALMASVAEAGEDPAADNLMAAALRDGLLAGQQGEALKRVLLALATAHGEALRLPTSRADVAGLILRARAEQFAYALGLNAGTLGEAELVRAIRGGCAALLGSAAEFARAQLAAGATADDAGAEPAEVAELEAEQLELTAGSGEVAA